MKTDLTTLVKENNGKISAIRVGFLLTLLVVLLNWSWINFHKKTEIAAFPENAVALIVGLAGAKTVQRYGEAKSGNKTTMTTTTTTATNIPTPVVADTSSTTNTTASNVVTI